MAFRIFTERRYIDNIDDCTALLFHLISSRQKNKLSLCIGGKGKEKEAEQAWRKLNANFVEAFGFSRDYKRFLRTLLKVEKLRFQILVEDKRSKKPLLEIEERKVNEFINRETRTVNEIGAELTREYQTRISPAECSVREFYSYLISKKDG